MAKGSTTKGAKGTAKKPAAKPAAKKPAAKPKAKGKPAQAQAAPIEQGTALPQQQDGAQQAT